jgi:hypothetical protein
MAGYSDMLKMYFQQHAETPVTEASDNENQSPQTPEVSPSTIRTQAPQSATSVSESESTTVAIANSTTYKSSAEALIREYPAQFQSRMDVISPFAPRSQTRDVVVSHKSEPTVLPSNQPDGARLSESWVQVNNSLVKSGYPALRIIPLRVRLS